MTKCIVIGESENASKSKPIEFLAEFLPSKSEMNCAFLAPVTSPNEWKNIELVCLGEGDNIDVMFAYDDDRRGGITYSGHWNDGFVEEGGESE